MIFTLRVLLVATALALALTPAEPRPPAAGLRTLRSEANFSGRWDVRFNFTGVGEKHLILEAKTSGLGSISLLNTSESNGPVPGLQAASWTALTNDRISISSELELPYSTCCREMGTLMLKGKLNGPNKLEGTALFITSTTEEENPVGFRSMRGTFTAVREIKKP